MFSGKFTLFSLFFDSFRFSRLVKVVFDCFRWIRLESIVRTLVERVLWCFCLVWDVLDCFFEIVLDSSKMCESVLVASCCFLVFLSCFVQCFGWYTLFQIVFG